MRVAYERGSWYLEALMSLTVKCFYLAAALNAAGLALFAYREKWLLAALDLLAGALFLAAAIRAARREASKPAGS